ncbi:MAG: TetR/AcrR family transcriptional regulator [Ruminiclostridium sp.]|nr:TetR/AcrR family transcriptional regulator [Ruminiclostridium sp.]
MVNEISSEFSPKFLKDKRMEHAVAVCAGMFLERGIENVKMTDIAEESGVGVATLYRYFGTKTGIAAEAMTFLWNDLRELFGGIFDSPAFVSQSGIKQLHDLLRMYLVMYTAHRDFMKLLGEFDNFVLRENVPKEELRGYEKSVINFYPVFEEAFRRGVEDGTVRPAVDPGIFYTTYAHALTEMCKKFIAGEILPSDDFSDAEKELEALIDTAVYYLKK